MSYQILFKKLVPCAEELSLLITLTLSMYTLHPHSPALGNVIVMTYPESTSFHLLRVPDAFKHRNPPPEFPASTSDMDQGPVPEGPFVGGEAPTNNDSGGAAISGWLINIEGNSEPKLNACAIPCKGNMIVGVGTHGTLWIWTIR